MKKSRFTESQIVAILKEGEAGVAVAQITRKHGISAATYYHWKSKYGGAGVSELKRLRELERQYKILKEEHELLEKAIRFASDRKRKSSNSSKQTGPDTKSQ